MNSQNIEVGDSAYWFDKKQVATPYIIDIVNNKGIHFECDGGTTPMYSFEHIDKLTKDGNFKLVKKMNKKIIGYKLLKDTPSHNIGNIFTLDKNSNITFEGYLHYKEFCELKTKWFEPIYENKATGIFVETLAGKVKVTRKNLSLVGECAIPTSITEFNKIVGAVQSFGNAQIPGEYTLEIQTFKIGCQTFHVDDIPKIEAAIKQVQ